MRELRPKKLEDYVGQDGVKKNLSLFLQAARERPDTAADHVLLYGPPGIGKTTLAYIIATELGSALHITSGPALTRTGDLAAILTNLKNRDVLFIDEIHRLPKPVEEALYPVLEESRLDIIVGKGPSARTVRLPLQKITVVGATTKLALISSPLRDRFGLVLRLEHYRDDELAGIVERNASILSVKIDPEAATAIAVRSRKTPRIANRILKRASDLALIHKQETITAATVDELFSLMELDESGLFPQDIAYLTLLLDMFSGGPVGLETIATALSEDARTVEEFIEPYLMQQGFIKRTKKGREATDKAIQAVKKFNAHR